MVQRNVYSIHDLCKGKVIQLKYYKHLNKGAPQSHLGRQKMGWFLTDYPVHQVKLKYQLQKRNLDFNPEFSS